jgi:hypothetical protein
MIPDELLNILYCPACISEGKQLHLDHARPNWLICPDCGRKYPIVQDIPVMLIDVGERWMPVSVAELPETPTME